MPAVPGYKRARIAPRAGAGLTGARASLETPYGTLSSAWRLEGDRYTLDVTVPPNTSAQVTLWRTRLDGVREGGRALAGTAGILAARQQGSDVVVEVGSGSYAFSSGRAP